MNDVLADAWRGVTRRPNRSALTTLGVVLGVGGLVAIVGLAESGSVQIARRFDVFEATAVQVTLPHAASGMDEGTLVRQLTSLPGVVAAGTFTPVIAETTPVLASSPRTSRPQSVPFVVASPQGLRAADPVVLAGRLPDGWAVAHDPRLAVVGIGVARAAGVWPESGRDVLRLEGQPFTVAAVVTDRGAGFQLGSSVIADPAGAAEVVPVEALDRTVLVRTMRGSGQAVARSAALAAYPEDPEAVTVQVPPDPTQLRGRISSDTRSLLLALAVVTLAAAAVGIANTMLVSVWERRSEIGLRRALGASKLAVGAVLLAESGVVGTVGGFLGAAVGILAGAALAAARGWSYALPPLTLAAPLLGTVIGIVAGLHPALRAARVDPVESLRSS